MKGLSLFVLTCLLISLPSNAEAQLHADASVFATLDAQSASLETNVIIWRRYFHEHVELSNWEYETANYIEAHPRKPGLGIETGVEEKNCILANHLVLR